MNKTLHKKLTEQHLPATQPLMCAGSDDLFPGFIHELHLLHKVSKELLQPRPQAIATLLRLAKEV